MFFKSSLLASALFSVALAHMSIVSLCPGGKDAACLQGGPTDSDIKAPIATCDGIEAPLCSHKVQSSGSNTWKAGETVSVGFTSSGAAHGGGHCQFGLSYDGGNTFVVIHDELKYCFNTGPSTSNTPVVSSYQIDLPEDLPSGNDVVFAWSWVNAIGNREFYMNCADVNIEGTSGSFTGPKMVYPNYGPSNPKIPEFGGNYNTGLDIFDSRPQMTVGSGSSAPAYSGSGNTQPETVPVVEYTTSSSGTTQDTSNNSPQNYVDSGNAQQEVPPVVEYTTPPSETTQGYEAPVQAYANGYSGEQPEGGNSADPCKPGAIRCATSGTAYEVCLNGSWSSISCGTSATCQLSNNVPMCTGALAY